MKPNKFEKWEQTRQMGAWKYGLTFGSIWGLFVVVFVLLMDYFVSSNSGVPSPGRVILMFAIYWITGVILYRFILWNAKEKTYKAWKESQE